MLYKHNDQYGKVTYDYFLVKKIPGSSQMVPDYDSSSKLHQGLKSLLCFMLLHNCKAYVLIEMCVSHAAIL